MRKSSNPLISLPRTSSHCLSNIIAIANLAFQYPPRTTARAIVLGSSCYIIYSVFHHFVRVNRSNTDGYNGGLRFLVVICKVFYNYCNDNNISLHSKNFTLSYETDIPRHGKT